MNSRTRSITLASAAGLALASAAHAQQTFYEWTATLNDNWSNAGNWNPAGVPNVAGEVALFLGGKTCNLDMNVTVDKLGNSFGDTLNMLNDRDLTIIGTTDTTGDPDTGTFSIYGIVNMLATANATDITVRNDMLTIGNIDDLPAVINMSNSPNNRFRGFFGTETLIFDDSLHVRGSGQIGFNTLHIKHFGTITADQPTTLTIDPNPSGFFNAGELAAENGATLVLANGTYENAGGLIVARDGSAVLLSAAQLFGNGTIQTIGSGIIDIGTIGTATWLDAQTVSGTVRMLNDRDLKVTGPTSFTTLDMLATANGTQLYIDGPVTFSGTANLSNSPNNQFVALGGGLAGDHLTLTNATVRGSGNLGVNSLNIVNNSNIIADQPTTLLIDPAATLLNAPTGALIAQNGGTLRLQSATYDNQGIIAANDGSVVQLEGTTINGLLTGTGSGYFDILTIGASTRLESVTLDRRLNMVNDRDLAIRGDLQNNFSIDMHAASNGTQLYIDGPVAFTGGGTVNWSDSPNNQIVALGGGLPGDAFVNADNLIRGSGNLGVNTLDIINHATIRADYPGSTLTIDPATTFTNHGDLEAVNGATLLLNAGNYLNNGSLSASGGSTIELSSASIDGLITTDESSSIQILTIGASTRIHDADITGRLVQVNDRDLLVQGTINHLGDWDLLAASNGTQVYIDGPVLITGDGTLNLSNSVNNQLVALGGGLPGDELTIGDYTIHGAGNIGANTMNFTNNGTIIADQPSTLTIDPASTFTNLNIVRATGDSTLRLEGGIHDHTDGSLELQDQTRCDLNSATLTGHASATDDAYFNVLTIGASTRLVDLTIAGRLVQANDRDLLVQGTVNHTGDWDLEATTNGTQVYIDGPVTLAGDGSMNLSDSPNNQIVALGGSLPDDFITIVDHTIHGAGNIGANTLNLDNGGSIIADQPTALTIDPAATMTNPGTLRAASAAGMRLNGATYTSSGSVIVDTGSLMQLVAGTFTQTDGTMTVNGEFQADTNLLTIAGGSLAGTGLVDANTNNTAGTVAPGNSIGQLTIEGDYTQAADATLQVELAAGASDHLLVTGAAAVDGTIRAVATPGYIPLVGDEFEILTSPAVASSTLSAQVSGFPLDRIVEITVEPTRILLSVIANCVPDLNEDGVIDFFDLQMFLGLFAASDPQADLNDDGLLDFFDVLAFLQAFSNGCP